MNYEKKYYLCKKKKSNQKLMKQKRSLKRKEIIYLVVGCVFFLVCSVGYYHGQVSLRGKEKYKKFQSEFLKKEQTLNDLFDKLINNPINNTVDLVDFCRENNVDNNAFVFLVYQDFTISAWSSNEIIPAKKWKDSLPKVQQIDNKWTYAQQKATHETQYIGYLIINDIVDGDENIKVINNPIADSITIQQLKNEKKECYTIYNNAGQAVFTLCIPQNSKKSNSFALMEIILWMIAFSLLFFALINFLLRTKLFGTNTNYLFLLLTALLTLFPLVILRVFVFSSDLFSPIYYSSHYESLGKLFINSYLILIGSIFFMQFVNLKSLENRSKKTKISSSFVFIFCVLIVHVIVYSLITGITNDSVVVLKPEMIYQYDLMSIIAIISIIFILWSAFVITYKTLNEVFLLLKNKKTVFYIVGIELIIFFLLLFFVSCLSQGMHFFIPYLLSLLLIVLTIIFILQYKKWHNLLFFCVIYFVLSGIVLFTANQTVDDREKKYKEAMAGMILPIEDPFVLDSFKDLADEMEKDTVLTNMFADSMLLINDIEEYIILKYTQKYAEDYRVNIDVELEGDDMIKNQTLQIPSQDYQKSTDGKVLFKRIGFGRSEYTVRISVPTNNGLDNANIILFFRMYISSEQQPELEKTVQKEMSNYCYAGYENNILTMNAGSRNISYLFHLSDYKLDTLYSGMEFVSNNITHTVFKHDGMVLLVSSEKSIIWDKISFLVILFLGQLVFSPLTIFLSSLHYNSHSLWRPGFQESVQLFITILITLAVISSAFLFFRFFQIQRNNDEESTQIRISQKINKTANLFLSDIEDITDLSNEALARINKELRHFYELDFLDLNLYNKKGENVERYGKGIYINTYINPAAIEVLTLSKTGYYVAAEFYKGREYKSVYETILNKKGDIIGYTNLIRYQHKQKEAIDYKHAQFLTKFMSTCVIFILLTIISSIFLIRYFIYPLLKVTERLSKIKLGEELKEVKWGKDDELGALVNTYNILIDRLKTSAELIEKSSQEVAWKDMAKQVAHEIKNPLTPMRLTTQHLLRELNTNQNIDREKLTHYLSMIIQQTDTLTDIASSFSDFAKINQQEGTPEDLIPIIQNARASYGENPAILFYLKNKTGVENVMSFINKSQISQVFNNLIKNAIQAKKLDNIQTITIEIENHGDKMWQIKVSDTGIGMTDEVKKKIFSPNFTTKTSGMGLGLAMVQRIIATWGGSITFESTYNVGTAFFITLPKYIK